MTMVVCSFIEKNVGCRQGKQCLPTNPFWGTLEFVFSEFWIAFTISWSIHYTWIPLEAFFRIIVAVFRKCLQYFSDNKWRQKLLKTMLDKFKIGREDWSELVQWEISFFPMKVIFKMFKTVRLFPLNILPSAFTFPTLQASLLGNQERYTRPKNKETWSCVSQWNGRCPMVAWWLKHPKLALK